MSDEQNFDVPTELVMKVIQEMAQTDSHLAVRLEAAYWKAAALWEREQSQQVEETDKTPSQ